MPPEGASIAELVNGREWLFADDSYHVDISHLASVVRMSTLVTDPAMIAKAVELDRIWTQALASPSVRRPAAF